MLTEACGPKFNNEVLMLVTAAMARVPTELRATEPDSISDADMNRLAGRIQREFGVTESLARWAVGTWAFALGIPPANTPTRVAASTPAEDAEPPPSDTSTSATSSTSTLGSFPVSREGLLAAIREAQSDGVVSPDEREALKQLATKVRLQLGDAALLPAETPRWRRWMVPGIVAGVLLLALTAVIFTIASRSEHPIEPPPASSNAIIQNVSPQPVDRSAELRALRERSEAMKGELLALREQHLSALADAKAYADRLKRAAEQARDQGRSSFRMAGISYTQASAIKTLAYADQYIADRASDTSALSKRLEQIDGLLKQIESNTQSVQSPATAPTTIPARKVPAFDVSQVGQ